MELLDRIGKTVQKHYDKSHRVLSYGEYLKAVELNPHLHLRNAAQYVRDMFDYMGTEKVRHPRGEIRRFKLFDAEFDEGEGRLVGQEEVQNHIYRIINNFVRQGRVDRFILLHGPNGSSKSTITEMVSRGMEWYSARPEGAAYRFNWIFPTQKLSRSGIGFGSAGDATDPHGSYAHLDEEQVDARLPCEMSDHPILLVPREERVALLEAMITGDEFILSADILKGDLCPKCKLVYEALLTSYEGDYLKVLRHVQVERFWVSRRYRQASTRVEPQLAVDANASQITADRSVNALPTALQSTTLFELGGDLVQGNRGVIDYADLLKRNPEAYKYLLITVEEGRVALDRMNLFFDLVFLGSSNEVHLHHFQESPEWPSFKGRLELVRVPYLLDFHRERAIYDEQINEPQVAKHLAPHANAVAALWAVLSRMHRPSPDSHVEPLAGLVKKLTPMDKAALYADGQLPEGMRGDEAKALRAGIRAVWEVSRAEPVYEGQTGASPREVKTAIMNASQNNSYKCCTPEAVLEELRALVQEKTSYAYLRMEPKEGYYDHAAFVDVARTWYLDRADEDMRNATGLVEEASYGELFLRYVDQVTHFVRGEKMLNSVTGAYEEPDDGLMTDVEKELGIDSDAKQFRENVMTKIGAWSVDHSGEKPDYDDIFSEHLDRLRASYFEQQQLRLGKILRNTLRLLSDEEVSLSKEDAQQARVVVRRMQEEFGYCDDCAQEAIMLLARERYAEG